MANVKTWTYAYNTIPTNQTTAQLQAASLHHQRKEFLVAGGWTVVQSCDGTTYGEGDLLTDITKYIWSASGARTWMILKSPEGFFMGLDGSGTGDQSRAWLTVQLNSANVYQAEIYLHRVAPSGMATTTSCPTSTDKIGYTAQQVFRSTFSGTALFHFARTENGHWFELMGYSATGVICWTLMVNGLVDLPYSQAFSRYYPFGAMLFARFKESGAGAMGADFASDAPLYPAWKTWSPAGVALPTENICHICWVNALGTYYLLGTSYTAAKDGFNSTFPASPVWGLSRTGTYTFLGRLSDIELSNAPYAQGDVDGLSPTRVFIGNFLLPTNTTVNL